MMQKRSWRKIDADSPNTTAQTAMTQLLLTGKTSGSEWANAVHNGRRWFPKLDAAEEKCNCNN
eukprot:4825082-Amphidinium_carterae.1